MDIRSSRTGSKKVTGASDFGGQPIPKINDVTRPSGEFERPTITPPVPDPPQPDLSRLVAKPLSEKDMKKLELSKKDVARETAIKASKADEWMRTKCIPFGYSRRKKTNSGSDILTASSVGFEEMMKTYQWKFFWKLVFQSNNTPIQNTLRDDVDTVDQGVLQIPDSWTATSSKDLSPSESQLRRFILEVVKDYNSEHRKQPHFLLPGMQREMFWDVLDGLDTTDLSHIETDGNRAVCSEWSIFKVLMFPGMGNQEPVSELDVEHHVGSLICGSFTIPGCQLIVNTQLAYPTILGCFGSYPKPDLASRYVEDHCTLYNPVVQVADAKRHLKKPVLESSNTPLETSTPHRVLAQLACAVQPTLQLLMILLENGLEKKILKPTTLLESWMFVYGISYDYQGLSLHAFFPRLEIKNDKRSWSFEAHTTLSQYAQAFCPNQSSGRPAALRLFLVAQRQARIFMKEYTALKAKVQLPQEFVDLEATWLHNKL